MKSVFVFGTMILAFYMNFYKLGIFEQLQKTGEDYYIFPWQGDEAYLSKSIPRWLSAHLVLALWHVVVTSLWVLDLVKSDSHAYSHIAFTAHILPNLTHFGDKPELLAFITNAAPLSVMFYCLGFPITDNVPQFYKNVYFIALTFPIWLETSKWLAGANV